jgi:hypothetical protein
MAQMAVAIETAGYSQRFVRIIASNFGILFQTASKASAQLVP